MHTRSRRALLGSLLIPLIGMGRTPATEPRGPLPLATLVGSSRLTFLGIGVYQASLWVEPAFKAGEYERHAFALEIAYLRDFTNEEITQRSIIEMRRQPGFPTAQLKSWQQALRGAFPNVRKGDRITGIHNPAQGVVFITNGQQTGLVPDAEFGRFFFGIWLSVHTSEPRLREDLLAGLASR